jgi:hypothetical protein
MTEVSPIENAGLRPFLAGRVDAADSRAMSQVQVPSVSYWSGGLLKTLGSVRFCGVHPSRKNIQKFADLS